jgi:hypothetical protein
MHMKLTRNLLFQSHVVVPARLKTRIMFADVGASLPHGRSTITSDCGFDIVLQIEIYGTVEFDLLDH